MEKKERFELFNICEYTTTKGKNEGRRKTAYRDDKEDEIRIEGRNKIKPRKSKP